MLLGPFFSIQYVEFLFFFKFKTSLPNNLTKNDVGVTTKKNTTPIIIGDTIFPSSIPNLNQSLFNGVKIDEFKQPRIRNIIDMISDQTLKSSSFNVGYNEIIKKIIKKTIPKLLLELILVFFLFNIKSMKVVFSYPLF